MDPTKLHGMFKEAAGQTLVGLAKTREAKPAPFPAGARSPMETSAPGGAFGQGNTDNWQGDLAKPVNPATAPQQGEIAETTPPKHTLVTKVGSATPKLAAGTRVFSNQSGLGGTIVAVHGPKPSVPGFPLLQGQYSIAWDRRVGDPQRVEHYIVEDKDHGNGHSPIVTMAARNDRLMAEHIAAKNNPETAKLMAGAVFNPGAENLTALKARATMEGDAARVDMASKHQAMVDDMVELAIPSSLEAIRQNPPPGVKPAPGGGLLLSPEWVEANAEKTESRKANPPGIPEGAIDLTSNLSKAVKDLGPVAAAQKKLSGPKDLKHQQAAIKGWRKKGVTGKGSA